MERRKIAHKEIKRATCKKTTKKTLQATKEVKEVIPKYKPTTQSSYDERPIKMNPRGKYNLNFIDWDNEWEAVCEYMNNPEATQNPCMIDEKDFEKIVVSFFLSSRDEIWALILKQRTE